MSGALFRHMTHAHEPVLRLPLAPRTLNAVESSRVFSLMAEGFTSTQAEFAQRRGVPDLQPYVTPKAPSLNEFLKLPGVQESLELMAQARTRAAKIAICGDYDVDGVCSVAIAQAACQALGLATHCDTPCRRNEGYGLNFRMVEGATAEGCTVLLALDFGTTQHKVIRYAQEQGMQVVVIDHHKLGDFPLPSAEALINPNARGDKFQEFCAAGLCMMWAASIRKELGVPLNMDKICAMSALATVADVMPLSKESNRAVVRHGRALVTQHEGLATLCEVLGIKGEASFSDLAFQIGPALNAPGRIRARNFDSCGRLERGALESQDLLFGHSKGLTSEQLTELASSIRSANQDRKTRERIDYQRALKLLRGGPLGRAIVLASDSFDPGLVGLVASRLSENYARPVEAIVWDGKIGKGSVRSGGDLRVYEALHRCREHEMHYGGHDAAGGNKLKREQFEAFASAFAAETFRQLGPFKAPTIQTDFAMSLAEVERGLEGLADELSLFEPFGNGHLAPRILIPNVTISSFLPIGAEHFLVKLSEKSARGEAYLWRGTESPLLKLAGHKVTLACRLGWYRGQGSREQAPSLEIEGGASAR